MGFSVGGGGGHKAPTSGSSSDIFCHVGSMMLPSQDKKKKTIRPNGIMNCPLSIDYCSVVTGIIMKKSIETNSSGEVCVCE